MTLQFLTFSHRWDRIFQPSHTYETVILNFNLDCQMIIHKFLKIYENIYMVVIFNHFNYNTLTRLAPLLNEGEGEWVRIHNTHYT